MPKNTHDASAGHTSEPPVLPDKLKKSESLETLKSFDKGLTGLKVYKSGEKNAGKPKKTKSEENFAEGPEGPEKSYLPTKKKETLIGTRGVFKTKSNEAALNLGEIRPYEQPKNDKPYKDDEISPSYKPPHREESRGSIFSQPLGEYLQGRIGPWRRIQSRPFVREFLAEMTGTFILLWFGMASHAALRLKWRMTLLTTENETSFLIGVGYGFGAIVALSAALPISGGHLNPAVTTALFSIRRCSLSKIFWYIPAQHLGGLLAAILLYAVFRDGINYEKAFLVLKPALSEEEKLKHLASFYTTFPSPNINIITAIFDQIFATGLLVFSILCVEGSGIPRKLLPLAVGFLLTGVIMIDVYNCSAILNPARDFPSRLLAFLLYGPMVFEPLSYQYYWVVGVAAPHVGGIFGAWIYLLFFSPASAEGAGEIESRKEMV